MFYHFVLAFAWIWGVLAGIGLLFGETPKKGYSYLDVAFAICCWAFVIASFWR